MMHHNRFAPTTPDSCSITMQLMKQNYFFLFFFCLVSPQGGGGRTNRPPPLGYTPFENIIKSFFLFFFTRLCNFMFLYYLCTFSIIRFSKCKIIFQKNFLYEYEYRMRVRECFLTCSNINGR